MEGIVDTMWELILSLLITLGLLSLRQVLTRFCFIPFGSYLGLRSTRSKPAPPNPLLEENYRKWKNLSYPQISGLSKQLHMSERQIERWIRRRKTQDRPSLLVKFSESCWKCSYYCCMFLYGLVILWDKPWFWDITQCWSGYPEQMMTTDIWWHYMISLYFYWSLLIEVRRKVHAATVLLISFSWLMGAFMVGSLVLVVHDCGNIFLEAAKMAKYADYRGTYTLLLSVFTVVWIVTRFGVFPLWAVKQLGTFFEIF